ncbi:MAG: hypothetical protein G01um10142_278 [Parcubacteria group bacterium Gr01-1014_2]|nr:MAG: hypothetical protein G01um10142_278 [Parcubacteria group bacterium Gr01-1014_2]
MTKIRVPAATWKRTGAILVSLGFLFVVVGAGTSDRASAMGMPSLFDGAALGIIGLLLFAAGAVLLAEKG